MLIKKTENHVSEYRVARTIFGRPLYFNHFYHVGDLLIDCGPAHVADEVIAAVQEIAVSKMAITHQHEDHSGNCALLQQQLGITVYAHPETIKILENPPQIQLYRKVMWGKQPRCTALPIEKEISAGKYLFQVIHTPGHSSDHISFFEPEQKWLFCGDLYLGDKLNAFMAGENIVDHLSSLQKAMELRPRILFCGLKGKLENAEDRLKRKYENWWNLANRVSRLHSAGWNQKKIIGEIFGGEAFFYYFSQRNWGRRFMIESMIENIDYFLSDQKKPLAGQ